ncbi:hypothetical protein ECZU28_06380 [Escherichia coli]|nr:hypothetical protein ECZU28_06380 [Escherichia coli]
MTVTTGGVTTATGAHQRPATDAGIRLQRHGQAGECAHPRTGPDIRIPYATDPAGNRLPDPELHPDSTLTVWPDNRIAEDAHYVYRHDEYGRLTEKTDRIPAGVIRTDDERTHHYHYDSQHRPVFYTRIQHGEPLVESRYLYDPLGRRMAKRVWRRERDLTGGCRCRVNRR